MTPADSEEKQNKKSNHDKMGTEPVGRLLASMAWPAMLSMTVHALYNVVDSMFVAMISRNALTAVSIVQPVQMLMISVAVGTGIGINSLISRRLGERRFEEADAAASSSVRIGLFNYIIFAIIGIFLTVPFMKLYSDNAEILNGGISYMRIITIGSFFSIMEIQLEKVLQATGNMISPMIISISGGLTNLILDPVLIFGLLGMPEMGIAGAAAATVIGQAVSLIVAIGILIKKNHDVKIRIRGFKTDFRIIRDIYSVGFPSMIMQSISSVLLLGYNGIISNSATAVAVLGVYYKLQSFVFMPVFGINQGAMPIMGYNYGAKSKSRLMKTYRSALMTAVVIMAFGLIAFQLFPEFLMNMFSADDAMLEMGIPALRIISISFLPAAFGIITSTFFQGTGHGVSSLMGSVIRQLVGILPLAYVLYNFAGVTASWASFPLAEILGVLYSAIMFTYFYRKEIRNL